MDSPQLICWTCRRFFRSEHELSEHSENEHLIKCQKFHCNACNKSFRDSYNLKRHIAFMHSPKTNSKFQKNAKCPLCAVNALKTDIIKHFSSVHQINVEEEDMEFESFELFKHWKCQIENETKSRFVKVRNVYKYKDGSTLDSFYCHRDGFVKSSRSKSVRRMKFFGSNKINGHCPSKIVVKSDTLGRVFVKFVRTHVGHNAELGRICLSRKEKEALAEKLAKNIPFDQILDDIRDSIRDSDLQRVHLLSKQDLRNIARDFKIYKKDTNPYNTSFDIVLDTVCTEDLDFIRLYKPKGAISNKFPQLKAKDFLLLIMNDIQKELLDTYGNGYICIDFTRGIHINDVDMYTLYVIDSMQQAFPCAFGFSNRYDLVVMEIFLYGIQEVTKKVINPNLLITNELLHDAWCAVMTAPSTHLYCTWLVDVDWRNNLKKIQDKEKQAVIYKQLRILLEEKDGKSFSEYMENLYFHFHSDTDVEGFLKYFEKYRNNCEKWAYCHRKHLSESFQDIEKLHKSLKYIYLKRKKVHNLGDTIFRLMAFLRDKFLCHPILTVFDRLMFIKTGHKIAINMTQANLRKINDTSWDVSEPDNDEVFHVEQVKFVCENCLLRCKPCLVCIHLYACSCYESTIKWNMCQHIHLACIVAKHEQSVSANGEVDKSINVAEDDHFSECESASITLAHTDSDSENLNIIHHINSPSNTNFLIEMKKKEILKKFTDLLENTTNLEQLDLISKRLTHCEQEFEITNQAKPKGNP